jgi:hypothetical protein
MCRLLANQNEEGDKIWLGRGWISAAQIISRRDYEEKTKR